MQATLIECKNNPGEFRVEGIADDGGCEVAIFSGPRARERAIAFASSSGAYDGWTDPYAAENLVLPYSSPPADDGEPWK